MANYILFSKKIYNSLKENNINLNSKSDIREHIKESKDLFSLNDEIIFYELFSKSIVEYDIEELKDENHNLWKNNNDFSFDNAMTLVNFLYSVKDNKVAGKKIAYKAKYNDCIIFNRNLLVRGETIDLDLDFLKKIVLEYNFDLEILKMVSPIQQMLIINSEKSIVKKRQLLQSLETNLSICKYGVYFENGKNLDVLNEFLDYFEKDIKNVYKNSKYLLVSLIKLCNLNKEIVNRILNICDIVCDYTIIFYMYKRGITDMIDLSKYKKGYIMSCIDYDMSRKLFNLDESYYELVKLFKRVEYNNDNSLFITSLLVTLQTLEDDEKFNTLSEIFAHILFKKVFAYNSKVTPSTFFNSVGIIEINKERLDKFFEIILETFLRFEHTLRYTKIIKKVVSDDFKKYNPFMEKFFQAVENSNGKNLLKKEYIKSML